MASLLGGQLLERDLHEWLQLGGKFAGVGRLGIVGGPDAEFAQAGGVILVTGQLKFQRVDLAERLFKDEDRNVAPSDAAADLPARLKIAVDGVRRGVCPRGEGLRGALEANLVVADHGLEFGEEEIAEHAFVIDAARAPAGKPRIGQHFEPQGRDAGQIAMQQHVVHFMFRLVAADKYDPLGLDGDGRDIPVGFRRREDSPVARVLGFLGQPLSEAAVAMLAAELGFIGLFSTCRLN